MQRHHGICLQGLQQLFSLGWQPHSKIGTKIRLNWQSLWFPQSPSSSSATTRNPRFSILLDFLLFLCFESFTAIPMKDHALDAAKTFLS